MKKFVITILSLLAGVVSLWAVWEGNGVVGTPSEFSEDGMFVKSSIFPKYTLVEIVNLENGSKVKAIVLEGEEREGILLSFSPSVAKALKVKGDSIVRIRVESSAVAGEGDKSGAVEKEGKSEDGATLFYDSTPIAKQKGKKEKEGEGISFEPSFVEDDVALSLPPTPPSSETNVKKEEEKNVAPSGKNEKKKEASLPPPPPPKTVSTPPARRPIYLEEVSMRPPKEVLPPKEEKKEVEGKVAAPVSSVAGVKATPASEEELSKTKDESRSVEEVEGIKDEKEMAGVSETVAESEKVKDAPSIAEPSSSEEEKTIKDVENVSSPKEMRREEAVFSEPSVGEIGQIEEVVADDERIVEPVDEVESPVAGKVQKDEEVVDAVPIVGLVAKSDDMEREEEEGDESIEEPFIEESFEEREIAIDDEPFYVAAAREPLIIEEGVEGGVALPPSNKAKSEASDVGMKKAPNKEDEKEPDTAAIASTASESNAKSEGAIEDSSIFGKVQSGYSYVQIAVFTSLPSAREVIEKYGKQYPIVLEKKGESAYAILIGPLKKGEIGAIKERFKAFGFADAYLK